MNVMPESPPQASRPATESSAGGNDVLGRRIAAALVDLALLFGVFVILSVTIRGVSVAVPKLAIYVGLALLYYFALEAANGRTVGKLVVGLQVVGPDGARPSLLAIAIRTALRVVDWFPLLYLIGFVAMIATGARRQRLGDLAAKTSVLRALPIRRRGIAAVLLGFFVFLALAVSAVSVADLDDLTSGATSASSACVSGRCNVTVSGEQVLELSDRAVVAISEIGADNATFTIDGDTVALEVGEASQVGPSLVHLTSVEDNVVKFSVDFSGLFLNRSDLQNEVADETTLYESYTQATDDQGVIAVELPVEWDDLDGREDPEYGPSIHAAPDLGRFRHTWDVPGIMIEVSSRFGPDDIGAIINQLGPSSQCTSEGQKPYEDSQYTGEIERWTGCGGTGTVIVVAAIAPAGGDFLVRMLGQAVDDRDLDALNRALATLEISGLRREEPRTTATDEDWLEKIRTLRTDIDDAIGPGEVELTSSVLTDMATAMRTCSRELASIGPPSRRLQRIHALVEKACQKYDEGADCLSTAADIGPVAGTREDRRLTDALDCGFAGLNRGSELLIDAEIEADSVTAEPG